MTTSRMDPADQQLLARAAQLQRPLAKAARLARGNGTSVFVFGMLSLIVTAFDPNVLGVFIGAVVTLTGWAEVKFAPRLARADPDAPLLLARNELMLMLGILIYAAAQLAGGEESSAELARQVGDTGALGIDIGALAESANLVVYATVIAVTVLYQGGLARHFLRRREDIATYRREIPEWARQVVEGLAD